MKDDAIARRFFDAQPLLPAAGLFLLGAALATGGIDAAAPITGACAAFASWLLLEWRRWQAPAQLALAAGILLAGMAAWGLDQGRVDADHIVRWTPASGECIVTLRAVVDVSPGEHAGDADATARGPRTWIGRATEIRTSAGWRPVTGEILVSSVAPGGLQAGTAVELGGWLSRPPEAANPGAASPRERLAADRVFAALRVPRASGVIVLDASQAKSDSFLARARRMLREKLLAHLIPEDVPAAKALTALLLGYRDPAISDVSQAFSDAGVAHLLAISGSHVVFFAWVVWLVLRYLPLRPRWREAVTAALVGLYILATPCGPPIVRAGVAVILVLLGRLMGRPRQYLNMLAAAAIVVVLLRPMDLLDAGFQLSFVCTAALFILGPRVHAALFGRSLERQALVAALARTRWSRWRLRAARAAAALLSANLVAALAAMPLVALHFGQVNLWAVVAGIVALPVVSAAMLLSGVQLLLELCGMGAVLSAPAAFAGRMMIDVVTLLARLPGAAEPLRAPPVWLVFTLYAGLAAWAMRRWLHLSRALIANTVVALAALTAGWYALSAPVHQPQLVLLRTGGSCMVLRTPTGALWTIDAGSQTQFPLLAQALSPLLRQQGARRLDGQILTALDAGHARDAGEVIDAALPRSLLTSQPGWASADQTLAGALTAQAAADHGTKILPLLAGQTFDVDGIRAHVLWPPATGDMNRRDLILLLEIAGTRVLIADPYSAGPLALLRPAPCDIIIFSGPQRGAGDDKLRRAVQGDHARATIWNGRGNWAPATCFPGEWNTNDGAIAVDFTPGHAVVTRAR